MHEKLNFSVEKKPAGLETDFIRPVVAKQIGEFLLKNQKTCHGVDCPLKEKISSSLEKMGKILKTFHQENLSSGDELFDIYRLSFETQFGKPFEDIQNLLFQAKIFVSQNMIKGNLNSESLRKDFYSLRKYLAENGAENMIIWLMIFAVFEISKSKYGISEYELEKNSKNFFGYCSLFSSSLELDYQACEAISIFYACTKLV